MLESLDINSLLSGVAGVVSALATIKAKILLLEWRVKTLEKDFAEHEKKAAH